MQQTVATVPTRVPARRGHRPRHVGPSNGPLDGWARAVMAIVALQGMLLVWGTSGGWFYQDDLTNLAEADGRSFDLAYLGMRVNDHLAPVLRAQFWVMANVLPYDHVATVVWRVALALTATVLMAVLLRRLAGTGRVTILALGLYALTMLTLPSVLNLSSATQLLPAHVALVSCLLLWHRAWSTPDHLSSAAGAAGAGLLLGLAVASWEKAGLMALVLIAVTAWFPRDDAWLRACLRRWDRWLLLAAPTTAFGAAYLAGGAPDSGVTVAPVSIARATGVAWLDAVAPALVGGPWRWQSVDGVFFSVADPPLAGVVVAQVVVAAGLVLLVRRGGVRALAPLLLPVGYLAASVALVSLGRYEYFGDLIARNYHYVSELAVPLAVGLALAGRTRRRGVRAAGRGTRAVVAVVLVLALGGTAVSAHGFRARWAQNPTRAYLDTLQAEIAQRSLTEPVALVDVDVPFSVQPFIAGERRVSALLGPLDLPVRFDGDGTTLVPDDRGQLREAGFLEAASSTEDPAVFCSHPLFGEDSVRVDLEGPAGSSAAFLRLEVLQDRTGAVEVHVGDAYGRYAEPETGVRQVIRAGPRTLVLRVPDGAWTQVDVTSRNPAQTLCVVHAATGTPVAVQP